jgi:cysteinyl-tRNA synthetase
VFRLHDTRTGQAEVITPARPGELRVYACGPTVSRRAHAGDLRSALLPDLIRRSAERSRLTVIVSQSIADEGLTTPELAHRYEDAFRADCSALNIRPPDHSPRASDSTGLEYLGEVIDIHTGDIDLRHGWDSAAVTATVESQPRYSNCPARAGGTIAAGHPVTGHQVVRHWVDGGQLLFDGREMTASGPGVLLLSDVTDRGLDPLALRLALLEHRYRQRVDLTWDMLRAADATLRQWRERVADWAWSPSKPMCAQYVSDIVTAFDDDLDSPAALRALRGLEADKQIPPGSAFETFAHVDRLLGLDLARDVGRPRAVTPPRAVTRPPDAR